jgi:DNA primase catalytic subunit
VNKRENICEKDYYKEYFPQKKLEELTSGDIKKRRIGFGDGLNI